MSETILIADDSLMVRETAAAALQDRGARVITTREGEEALAALRAEPSSLLLADAHLPGVDGYELCRAAKEIDPSPPVLLLVGTFEAYDEDAARDAGAAGVLRKPFAAQELRDRVEELLGPAPVSASEEAPAGELTAEQGVPETAEPAPPAGETPSDGEEPSAATIERIARRVLELGGVEILERVAREVFEEAAPDLLRQRRDDDRDAGRDRSADR